LSRHHLRNRVFAVFCGNYDLTPGKNPVSHGEGAQEIGFLLFVPKYILGEAMKKTRFLMRCEMDPRLRGDDIFRVGHPRNRVFAVFCGNYDLTPGKKPGFLFSTRLIVKLLRQFLFPSSLESPRVYVDRFQAANTCHRDRPIACGQKNRRLFWPIALVVSI
jgi:hypothetical protein